MSSLLVTIKDNCPEEQLLIEQLIEAKRLATMILIACQLGRMIAVLLVEACLAERSSAKTVWGTCDQCGKRLQSKGMRPRQIKSVIGVIKWKRRVGKCPNKCAIGQIAPFDDELGIESNQRADVGLKRSSCLLAIFVPFATSTHLLQEVVGVTVSPATVWNWVQTSGKKMMEALQAELDELKAGHHPEQEAIDEKVALQPLLMGGDGVMVPFRREKGSAGGRTKWREVKVGILARLGQVRNRSGETTARLHRHRVVAVLGDIDQFAERISLEAFKQGFLDTPQVVWLSDGARGFWRLFEEQFQPYSHVIPVLDFYHATQNIWSAAKRWLDGRTVSCKMWFSLARTRLRYGRTDALLDDLLTASQLPDLDDSTRHGLLKLHTYLDKHTDHTHYQQLKAMGLPIGSGFVESTCKWLIQQRFKGVGMRWSEDGFNALLHLRLAWVNGRFDPFFSLPTPSPKF